MITNQDWFGDDAMELVDYDDDSPYCECGEQPTEEEEAFNICSACGKPLS